MIKFFYNEEMEEFRWGAYYWQRRWANYCNYSRVLND